ncbi:UNKNOWN [Stylonychia lemnae]|uniref:Leucine Rich Repeat family protein n=1 Tax=Stylonychia lemnae TaxID=5949 RepID=A0A078AL10_STYLE|nr:UNKNOWN [Stylonychia lemnae]|eukprot:CDW81533.1 UNKNOWN [Stylonychia lemnae]
MRQKNKEVRLNHSIDLVNKLIFTRSTQNYLEISRNSEGVDLYNSSSKLDAQAEVGNQVIQGCRTQHHEQFKQILSQEEIQAHQLYCTFSYCQFSDEQQISINVQIENESAMQYSMARPVLITELGNQTQDRDESTMVETSLAGSANLRPAFLKNTKPRFIPFIQNRMNASMLSPYEDNSAYNESNNISKVSRINSPKKQYQPQINKSINNSPPVDRTKRQKQQQEHQISRYEEDQLQKKIDEGYKEVDNFVKKMQFELKYQRMTTINSPAFINASSLGKKQPWSHQKIKIIQQEVDSPILLRKKKDVSSFRMNKNGQSIDDSQKKGTAQALKMLNSGIYDSYRTGTNGPGDTFYSGGGFTQLRKSQIVNFDEKLKVFKDIEDQKKQQFKQDILERLEQTYNLNQFLESLLKTNKQTLRKDQQDKFQQFGNQPSADPVQKRFTDALLEQNQREMFLGNKLKTLNQAKNREGTLDFQMEFLRNCEQEHIVPIPQAVLNIQNNQFTLYNYSLSQEIIAALSNALQYVSENISAIHFSNNALQDEMTYEILSNLPHHNKLKHLIVSNQNEVGKQSSLLICHEFLEKPPPNALDSLKIVKCRVQSGAIMRILKTMNQQNFVRNLALSKCEMGLKEAQLLASIIQQNTQYLSSLDISWNQFGQKGLKVIFDSLSMNFNITELNISWNEIAEETDLKGLKRFIKTNERFFHLDISNSISTEKQIMTLLKTLKKSKSLQSVHFSQIQSIRQDQSIKAYMDASFDLIDYLNNAKPEKPTVLDIKNESWQTNYKFHHEKQVCEKEMEYFKFQQAIYLDDLPNKERLVLSRILGYPEIIGSEQWTLRRECFICQRWKYTLFVHKVQKKKDISKYVKMPIKHQQTLPIIPNNPLSLLKQQIASQIESDIVDDKIILTGSFESFMKKDEMQMINLNDIPKLVEKDFDQVKKDTEQEYLQDQKKNVPKMFQKHAATLDKVIVQRLYQNIWKKFYDEKIKTHHAQIIPRDQSVEQFDESLYIYADFVKPTCQVEIININNVSDLLDQTKIQQYFIPLVRLEDYKSLVVIEDEQYLEEYIEKNANVFEDWKADNEETYQKMLKEDFEFWKINRFIKDTEDIRACEQVIKDNIVVLKDIYITLISTSNYPNINWNEFTLFVKQANIVDEKTTFSAIDRSFIATNVELEQIAENPDRALCRYEFFEVLVRIAGQKFKESRLVATYSEALTKLLKEHVISKTQRLPWQSFRDKYLWVRDVNLVFDQNMIGLQKLYSKYFSYKQKFMTFANAQDLMAKEIKLQTATLRDIVMCYGLCKMTVTNEMRYKDINPYIKLNFVEFLEYIGRIAHEEYKGLDIPLYQKIENILDMILPLVGTVRNEIQRHEVVLKSTKNPLFTKFQNNLKKKVMANINVQLYDSDSDDEEQDELYLKYFANNNSSNQNSKKRLSTDYIYQEIDLANLNMDNGSIIPSTRYH